MSRIVESLYRICGIELNEDFGYLDLDLTKDSLNETTTDTKIKCIGMADEHVFIKEIENINERQNILSNMPGESFFTYAWIESPLGELPIAVAPHHATQLKFKKYQRPWVTTYPIWNFIADERTPDQQKFIEKHIDEIDKAFKEYIIKSNF